MGTLQFLQNIIKEHPRWLLFLQGILTLLGLILVVLDIHLAFNHTALLHVAFLLLGASCALMFALWEQTFLGYSGKYLVSCVVVQLTVFSGVFSLSAYISLLTSCIIAAGATFASTLLWTQRKDVHKQDKAVQSRMLDLMSRQLLVRYFCAFALLGFCTGAMLSLFSSGIAAPPSMDVTDYVFVGVIFLVILLALGWMRNKEFDFILTYSLLVLVAVAAFFPINPGTVFNQHIALIIGAAWFIVLLGNLIFMSREIDLLSSYARKSSVGLGFTGLFLGLALGVCLMYAILLSPWYQELLVGETRGVEFATACGALTLVVSFLCTNVLLNKDFIQTVRLATKGRFATTIHLPSKQELQTDVSQHDIDTARDKTSSEVKQKQGWDEIEVNCRAITLKMGLTPREYEVLVILAHGNSLARVQSDLVISEGTAITHRRNIYRKLVVHSKQELLDYVSSYEESVLR